MDLGTVKPKRKLRMAFHPSLINTNLSVTSITSPTPSLPILKNKSFSNHYYASTVASKLFFFFFLFSFFILDTSASRTLSTDPFALPIHEEGLIPPPNISTCFNPPTYLPSWARVKNCCPPVPSDPSKIITFREHQKTTTDNTKLRARRPLHEISEDPEYLDKFVRAMQAMRDLPDSDPRSFNQQGAIHCAYCSGAYPQFPWSKSATNDNPLQIHLCWLFFPFHRWYLYFTEKILGKLIGDPYFALPFWNWDHPDGMQMPRIYTDNASSPLFDSYRNFAHFAPTIVDLNYNLDVGDVSHEDVIKYNLNIMHRQMVHANTPELFMGQRYRVGSKSSGFGQISGSGAFENIPHNTVHSWVGDTEMPIDEDMGTYYAAGFDPLFYGHHSNIDRLWTVWKSLPGKYRKDFTNQEWLDSGFIFYDENLNAVKVTVRDCLETESLGYVYQDVENLWNLKEYKPKPRLALKTSNAKRPAAPADEETSFPVVLDSSKKFHVMRPERLPQEEENVILVIDFEFLRAESVKIDVFINVEDDVSYTPETTEFAGSFTNVAHGNEGQIKRSRLKINVSDMLVDLQVPDDDKTVLVTLVPMIGSGKYRVGGITIKFERSSTESA